MTVSPEFLLVMVLAFPLASFAILVGGGRRLDGRRAAVVGSAAIALALLAAFGAVLGARSTGALDVHLYEWMRVGRQEVAITVATSDLEELVRVDRSQVGRVWWPTDPGVEGVLERMWDPDAAAGERPMRADVPAGSLLTDMNLPPSPTLVTGPVPRREPMSVDVGLRLDPLSALMILVVTGVGLLIHIYSAGYMAHDQGIRRYFAYLNLFSFSMLLLVLADNFLLMFVGWELVGLCSYLLIGFWYEDVANASAGRKAFVVNRVGDFAFVIGLLAIWATFGSLAFEGVLPEAGTRLATGGIAATVIALCLFIGATGKSAQIPLFVWLPDAMAGPTPVSALIHAATMVTAGVYMVARTHALFAQAPAVLDLIGVIGAATALMGALIALVQVDIKRVLAYSTVSQLGYMFLALGAGAYAAAVFHLMSHAFFKALLFLGAGSVMHAMNHGFQHAPPGQAEPTDRSGPFSNTPPHQDLRLMGGLAPRIRWTAGTFAVGALALAGLFPLVGFWSKDEILYEAFARGGGLWIVLYGVALLTAGITAYYSGRLLFMTFAGESRSAGAANAEESPRVMVLPLLVLALLTVAGGIAAVPTADGPWIATYLAPAVGDHHGSGPSKVLMAVVALAVSVTGLGLAWRNHGRGAEGAKELPAAGPAAWAANAFGVDRAYAVAIALPFRKTADWLWKTVDDRLIDGVVNGVGRGIVASAQVLRRSQTGFARAYALWVLAGVAALAAYIVFMGQR